MVSTRTIPELIFDVINHCFMLVVFIVMTYPFIYVINYSLSTPALVKNTLLLLPKGMNIENYAILFRDATIWRALGISIARSILGPLIMLVISSMGAFALKKRDLVFGRFFRVFFLATMYFSAGIIPVYLTYQAYGLTNSFWVYIVPGIVNVFNMVLIRTYMEGMPSSLEEAVLIDGGTDIDAYARVILPLCLPVNAAVFMFSCVGHWNSYIDTQFYNAMSQDLYTLQYVLYNAMAVQLAKTLEEARTASQAASGVTSQSLKMAITVITVVPIACVYPLLQKHFVSGLLVGAIKA